MVFIFLLIFSLSSAGEQIRYIMGVPVYVKTEHRYINEVFKVVKKVDRYFSLYKKDSYLCRLNINKRAKYDAFFGELLDISSQIHRDTDGYFDFSLGNITVKKGYWVERCPISDNDSTGVSNIQIKNGFVYLRNKISLDFGAVAKGFAVDKAVDLLKKKVKKTVINISGEIRCLGSCRVFIKNPYGEGVIGFFETVKNETGVSTSGEYERGSHIIIPEGKASDKNFVSVTIFGSVPNAFLDGYSTAVFLMPVKKAVIFLNSKKLGFVLITKNRCYIKGQYNSLYIKNLTLLEKLPECLINEKN